MMVKNQIPRGLVGVGMLGLAVILIACAETRPTQFYTLAAPAAVVSAPEATDRELAVGVGPVTLPAYLERPQIVVRDGPHTVRVAEFSSWVEPLDTMFPRVLAANLSELLATDDVYVMPRRRTLDFDYQVEVDVLRFDSTTDGRAVLDVQYQLFGRNGGRLVHQDRAQIVETVADPGSQAAAVAALSTALADFSRQIAAAIEDAASG